MTDYPTPTGALVVSAARRRVVRGFRPEALRRAREAQDWTREVLARRVGVTTKTIQHYETSHRVPSPERLALLAWELGTLPSKLAEVPEVPEVPNRLAEIRQRFADGRMTDTDVWWLFAHIDSLHRLTALPVVPAAVPTIRSAGAA